MLLCQLLQGRFPCLQIPRKKQCEVWTCLSNFRLACSQRLMDHVLCAHAAKLLNWNTGLGAVWSQQVRGIATWSCTPAGNWHGRRGNTAQWRKSAWQSGRRWTVVVRSSHTQTDVTVSEQDWGLVQLHQQLWSDQLITAFVIEIYGSSRFKVLYSFYYYYYFI